MVLLSFVLVIVAAVTLVIGLLTSGLPWVFVSIACSAVAGVVLIAAVLRSRPRPVTAGGAPAPLTATSEPQWGGTPTAVFAEEDDEEAAAEPASAAAGFAPTTAEFPIEDYNDLKVGEIVPLLSELDVDELEAVRDRETAGKARASVLTCIDVLLDESRSGAMAGATAGDDAWTASDFPVATDGGGLDIEFPIADYDELRVGEITPLLAELEPDELEAVRQHEAAGKARAGIIARIDALLGPSAPAKRAPAKRTPAKKTAATAKKATAAKKPAAKKTAATAKKATAAKKPAAKKTR